MKTPKGWRYYYKQGQQKERAKYAPHIKKLQVKLSQLRTKLKQARQQGNNRKEDAYEKEIRRHEQWLKEGTKWFEQRKQRLDKMGLVAKKTLKVDAKPSRRAVVQKQRQPKVIVRGQVKPAKSAATQRKELVKKTKERIKTKASILKAIL